MNYNTAQERIRRLFDLGHFNNPNHKNSWNITINDLPKLTINDRVVKDATASFQDMMIYDFESLSYKFHGRRASCDGDFCAATIDLFEVRRCGHPDYHPQPANNGFVGKVGSGSFPEPCQKGGIKVHINKSRMPSNLVARWVEIQNMVFNAYHNIGANLVEVLDPSEAHIRVWWEGLAGSTIGMAEFNSQSCNVNDWVFCKLDPNYTDLMFELFAHELGHNNNLNHTRGGMMNPSIIPVNPKSWNPNDPSYSTLVRYYGGEPIGPTPTVVTVSLINPPVNITNIEVDFKLYELRTKKNNELIDKYNLLSNRII